MPDFTVIAGPNGAGKSTYSSLISKPNTIIFDPDKEKIILEKRFSDLSDEAIQNNLTNKYLEFEAQALETGKHFSVETNLRNTFIIQRGEFFKNQGYNMNMVFMLLPNISSSVDRVNLRVKKHGHFVGIDDIKENFVQGLVNLEKVANLFDNLMLICTASNYEIVAAPELFLTIKSGQVIHLNSTIPDWALPTINTIKNCAELSQITPPKPWEQDGQNPNIKPGYGR